MADRTSRLAIIVDVVDKGAGKLAKVRSEVAALGPAGRLGSLGLAKVEAGASRLGGALAHARGAIGSLLTGPLGMVGLGAGLFGLGAAFTSSIAKAQEFGDATYRLSKVIGLNADATSRLVDTLDKFGIAGDAQVKLFGLLEKNAAKLGATKQKATKFEQAYGFSLTDTNGRIVDANELLKRSADFFTSNASATKKATALSSLYGRSWQQLIPILSQGRAGIEKEERDALHLSHDQLKNVAALRGAQREWNDTLGDTQTLIGLELLPSLTKFVRIANSFVQTNQGSILAGVRGAVNLAGEVVDAVASLAPIAKGIAGAWNAIPADFRKLLIGGLVANKVAKFTFGVDVLDALRKTLLNAVLGIKAGVVNVQGGVVNTGGGVPGAGGGKGGFSPLGVAGAAAGGLAIAAAYKSLVLDPSLNKQSADIRHNALGSIKGGADAQALQSGLAAVNTGLDKLKGIAGPLSDLLYGQQISDLEKTKQMYTDALAKLTKPVSATGTPGGLGEGGSKNLPDSKAVLRGLDKNGIDLRAIHAKQQEALAASRQGTTTVAGHLTSLQAAQAAGFGSVVAAVLGIAGAIKGLPVYVAAASSGVGAGAAGTPASAGAGAGASGSGNVGATGHLPTRVLSIKVTPSHRDTTKAKVISERWGPVAAATGAL
jgi:hypothetical protein